jgi:arabinofuranan 3-O-arabinosyltransferase
VVGTAIAFKPMLVPLALLFAFARRWRALGLLLGIPLLASGLGAFAMPNPEFFFTKTLPFLLGGQDEYAQPFDASLVAILPRLGVAELAAAAIAAALAGVGVWAAWRRWRRGGDERLRLVETASMLMLATFLVSRPAFLHYALVVIPVLLASLPLRGSVARSPWFWIVLLPQNAAIHWPYMSSPHRRVFRDVPMLTGLAVIVAWHSLRRDDPRRKPMPVEGQPVTKEPAEKEPAEKPPAAKELVNKREPAERGPVEWTSYEKSSE